VRVAVIGDFGADGPDEAAVAAQVKSWTPGVIVTVGDNNYPDGAASTIDANIGKYYHNFIYPYTGSFGAGASAIRFFPALGNRDWVAPNAQPYLDYFALPGNERYYDFIRGPLHIFVVDSDPHEPDGIGVTSTQALWLHQALSSSVAPWNLVIMHHSPYSSGFHQSYVVLQWPYASWGATAVIAGHDHHYERILQNGIAYFVNGTGGAEIFPPAAPIPGSQINYFQKHGAMLIDASPTWITFQFINVDGEVIDSYSVGAYRVNLPLVLKQP
jgi:hypothetical protein